ncbi:hypothetical protein CHRYSEO8AT_30019 [Chryseobacterium sp. 8AT]|nr:hypothetical protein CHRYSEO8AT_30019 [Chryseobacterium sp. 8AT]
MRQLFYLFTEKVFASYERPPSTQSICTKTLDWQHFGNALYASHERGKSGPGPYGPGGQFSLQTAPPLIDFKFPRFNFFRFFIFI